MAGLGVMPERTAGTREEFLQLVDGYKDIVIDGVECACVRPQDQTAQGKHYSGKKRHTVKSLVVSDFNRKILFLCCIVAGSVHDYALMKSVFKPGLAWLKKVNVWLDLGFIGATKDYLITHKPQPV